MLRGRFTTRLPILKPRAADFEGQQIVDINPLKFTETT